VDGRPIALRDIGVPLFVVARFAAEAVVLS
jgi:hypothetical protein